LKSYGLKLLFFNVISINILFAPRINAVIADEYTFFQIIRSELESCPYPYLMKVNIRKIMHLAATLSLGSFAIACPASQNQTITTFDDSDSSQLGWRITDDGVMGGRSRGQFEITDDGIMVFQGKLSLENNGGFSSVRSSNISLDLSDSRGLAVRVKGDGRTYQLRLSTQARYRSREVSFSADLKTREGEWIDLRVPFSEFKAGFRGRSLNDVAFDPSSIRRIGILLGDKRPGSFRLEVDSMSAYGGTPSNSIVDLVAGDDRFKTLGTVLGKAGLLETLQADGPFTVFAPTDAAFSKLPKETIDDLLSPENQSKLVSILTYHVVSGQNMLSDVLQTGILNTVQGSSVRVAFNKGSIRVNEANIQDADLQASNGLIHVIDAVLLPPAPESRTILATARSAGSFKTLLAAAETAGLLDVLDSDEPVTIFAPTDRAFAALPDGTVDMLLKPENLEQLQSILSNHAVMGRVSAGDALNASSAATVGGDTLKFKIRDGLLQVNNTTIRTADLECSNGMIHIIDAVLLPASPAGNPDSNASLEQKPVTIDAREEIKAAIYRGVPLYNGGNPAACADVYEKCIKLLASSGDTATDIRSRLARSLDSAISKNADERAWIYRLALDETLASLDRKRLR
jgi:transforming growth factor-beta-induced protein